MTASGDNPIRIAIAGAAGRMGQRLCALAVDDARLQLTQAIDAPDNPALGRPAASDSEVTIRDAFTGDCDALVDFSTPDATRKHIAACAEHGVALVIGTTGLTDTHEQAIQSAAESIPVVQATNFSLVVNVLNRLAGEAARMLGPDYDIELLEAHHRFKKDAPSGTALTLARTLCAATDRDFEKDVRYERVGHDATRQDHEITVQTLRLGDVVGEHTVMFAAPGERMELKHIGTSRDSYATGALHAAKWAAAQSPGRYGMPDVLGL